MTLPHELTGAKEFKRSFLSPQVGVVHGKAAWHSLHSVSTTGPGTTKTRVHILLSIGLHLRLFPRGPEDSNRVFIGEFPVHGAEVV